MVQLMAIVTLLPAHAEESRHVQVSLPNGYVNVTVNDLSIVSNAGNVTWTRYWNGQEWKFNPQWESLSQSWGNPIYRT